MSRVLNNLPGRWSPRVAPHPAPSCRSRRPTWQGWGYGLVFVPHTVMAAAPAVVELAPVVVSTPGQRDVAVLPSSVLVLEGQALVWRRQATLGDTLDGEPGIHADTFGAGASRPIIRGQEAPRVTVLSDGSPLLDASAVSPDHAIDVEPGLAQRIEVIRGPATLLYGGGALGGVVNVIDNKIPVAVPEQGIEFQAGGKVDTGATLREGAFGLTAGAGNLALRVEGLRRRSDDYRVPDQATTRQPDSFTDTRAGSVGVSWVTAAGYVGLAVTEQRRRYGLPGHTHGHASCHPHGTHLHCDDAGQWHAHRATTLRTAAVDHDDHDGYGEHDEHDLAGDAPWIDQRSQRWDWRAEYRDPLPSFQRVRLRGGWTDYRHDEVEAGVALSRFRNRGHDARVELEHRPLAGWQGTVGAALLRSDFDVTRPEAFMPRTVTESQALFLIETYRHGDWQFEVGARHDWQRVRPDGNRAGWRGGATSVSAGAVWQYTPGYSLASTVSRSQRMPNAQELYANGVHLATNTFEIGNPELSAETGVNWDLTWRKTAGATRFQVSAYHHDIRHYIDADTLDEVNDFRLVAYRQRDARFTGVEGRLEHSLSPVWTAILSGDLVRARFAGGGNLPRIPAARLGVGVRAQWQAWQGYLDYARVFAQTRIAAFESETAGYNLVNAGISYRWLTHGAEFEWALTGRNVLNVVAYNHASFLADSVPLPGRSIALSLQVRY